MFTNSKSICKVIFVLIYRQGNVNGAESAFYGMIEKNIQADKNVCSALLKVYAKSGEYERASKFVNKMEELFGVKPDNFIYAIVIDACAQAEKPKLAGSIFYNYKKATSNNLYLHFDHGIFCWLPITNMFRRLV